MTRRYLSLRDIAELTGMSLHAIKAIDHRDRLPEPDVVVGLGDMQQRISRGWSRETVDAWWSGYAGTRRVRSQEDPEAG